MSENKKPTENKVETPETGEKKAPKKGEGKSERVKRVKTAWSLQRCQRAARRFTNENEWRAGAPSSYKSATAHGWLGDCLAAQKKKGKAPDRKVA